jgi:hypothetical protein
MTLQFLGYRDFKSRGINTSPTQIWRQARDGKFPRPSQIGARNVWAAPVIDAYQQAIIAGASQAEATAQAEQVRQRLVDPAVAP